MYVLVLAYEHLALGWVMADSTRHLENSIGAS